ncbi:putative methyltransferase [Tolypocladium ophioglossoides CBS 100239]|uniref:Putative methyltransferase n=1 Tax=Tolypocladium ophioglossoides (strain CBS 100239) TaxID=1163406 RepID=A0A0L0NH35_TOLOC|nr:putative methyltransferase [Tolypocladium ophioglossoides CBS 100239]
MAHKHCRHHHQGSADAYKTLGERNKEHFDEVSGTAFDAPWIAQLCDQVSSELRSHFQWIGVRDSKTGRETKMLDYACGNGVVSRVCFHDVQSRPRTADFGQALSPFIPSIRGIDISSGMVSQYNLLAEKVGYSREHMHAVHGDFLDAKATPSPEVTSLDFHDFDLVVMSLALHHVDDTDEMIRKLADRLADGGVLVIVDWMDGSESGCQIPPLKDMPVKHTVSRMGFKEADLKQSFEKAGLGDWGWKWFASQSAVPEELGGKQQAFLARGVKRRG